MTDSKILNNLTTFLTGLKSSEIIAFFLFFCVISSKQILIYNEEILVSLSFFLFVWLVINYFGDTIRSSLEARSQEILQEFQQVLNYQEESLTLLKTEHQRAEKLSDLQVFLLNLTSKGISLRLKRSDNSLRYHFSHKLIEKVTGLAEFQNLFLNKLKPTLSTHLLAAVLVKARSLPVKIPEIEKQ